MARKPAAQKVLLVEDNSAYAEAMAALLQRDGLVVHRAETGIDGLLAARVIKPDLVLLDINMPEMDGLKMLKKMRSKPWGKRTPIVLLTVSSDATNLQRAIEYDTTDYLIKDQWEAGAIIAYVKRLLQQSRGREKD